MTTTSLFKPAEVTSAYLKMGVLGFAGTGKTKTATITAIGLIQEAKKRAIAYAEKPVYFLDTETGSDWVKPDFDRAGIKLYVAKTRAFTDLLLAVKEAEANGSLLLTDSVSHFWKEICDSYIQRKIQQLKERGAKNPTYRLQFQDWAYLKGEWGKFTDAFVNSSLHMILCGRAGYEYDFFEDDDGKKQLEKTGVKMKAEGEMGYEPSLLIHMERHQKIEGNSVAETWRTATVLKDRSTLLDGQEFKNPTFKDFLPHISLLNLGGKHLGVDTTRTSEHAISPEKKDWGPVQRRIAVDEIQTLLVFHIPGQTTAEKKRKVELVRKHFNNASWTEIEEVMPLFDLRAGYDGLHQELEGKPSRYHTAVISPSAPPAGKATTLAEDLKDGIPDFLVREAAVIPITEAVEPTEVPVKAGTVKERLLSDIPNLKSVHECLGWGLSMSDTFETLNKTDKARVHEALMAQQVKCMNGSGVHV